MCDTCVCTEGYSKISLNPILSFTPHSIEVGIGLCTQCLEYSIKMNSSGFATKQTGFRSWLLYLVDCIVITFMTVKFDIDICTWLGTVPGTYQVSNTLFLFFIVTFIIVPLAIRKPRLASEK